MHTPHEQSAASSVCGGHAPRACRGEDSRPRALLIMGLAASLDGWKPQLADLLAPGVRACQHCALDRSAEPGVARVVAAARLARVAPLASAAYVVVRTSTPPRG
jgi:hypothetical protein